MVKTSKDKSSQLPDFNSPNKSSLSEEEPDQEPLEKSSPKNKSPKPSPKHPSVNIMPVKLKEKTSPISKDSKSLSSEEDSLNYSEPNQHQNDSPLYLNISIFNLIIFIYISIFILFEGNHLFFIKLTFHIVLSFIIYPLYHSTVYILTPNFKMYSSSQNRNKIKPASQSIKK